MKSNIKNLSGTTSRQMRREESYWEKVASAFHGQADEYAGWFDNNLIVESELAALFSIKTPLAQPSLEIGVGPGFFATRLGISFGIDPAFAPLVKAKTNKLQVCRARGEQLPFGDQRFGTVFLLFTACFLQDPCMTFRECRRVITATGHLVVGVIPGESPWAKMLTAKGQNGHPLYRHALFRKKTHIERAVVESGFLVRETISTLRQPPGSSSLKMEKPRPGYDNTAGFVVMVAS